MHKSFIFWEKYSLSKSGSHNFQDSLDKATLMLFSANRGDFSYFRVLKTKQLPKLDWLK